jgi:eukaryotic-like serine/threonine-protein kinase
MALSPNSQFGRYEILSKLGAGGMGDVYLAQDGRLGRKVALKLLPSHFISDADRLRRFQQEARAASALNHPNILTIHEIGQIDDHPFIATEFIDGQTLREHTALALIKLEEALDVAVQVASALAAAHKGGIIHRDIKPENIMIRDDGFVKVLDFGLVKLTEKRATDSEASTLVNTDAGVVMGTARYMSPEQARGLEVDARTDIWSLGVVLYEMVAGRAPFEGGTPSDVLSLILQREPVPLVRYSPEVPTELERIVRKALHKDREERYQTVKDFLIDLKNLRQELQFKAELERSASPTRSGGAVAAMSSGQAVVKIVKQPAVQTSLVEAHTTSRAEYIVTEIKRHKRAAVLTFAALAVAAALSIYFYSHRAQPLTEKDTILLADFVNTTGDAVFDGTLKQALAVQMEQSPFLNISSDERVRQTLRYMGRTPDEHVTNQIAREICERQGIKAMLTGSIAGLGSHYVITLEALNVHAGDVIAREQTEAESKEQVLSKLGQAATKLREKLGESLASIQKFDAPVEQATTSSLEALNAFTLGNEKMLAGSFAEAIPFFKRAVELDPNFALAYADLSRAYYDTLQNGSAADYAKRAFELRERASEREKFLISQRYYQEVTGELDKSIEVLELWGQTYPRDFYPRSILSTNYILVGQYEKAIEKGREAISINPNSVVPYSLIGTAFLALNRPDEAKAILEEARAKKLDAPQIHQTLYVIAFFQEDQAGMQRQDEWAASNPKGGDMVRYVQGVGAAFDGRLRQSQEHFRRAMELSTQRNAREASAWSAAEYARSEAAFGQCQQTKREVADALAIARGDETLWRSGLALALCGEAAQTGTLISELSKRYPQNTIVNMIWLPTIRAVLETNRGNPAQAIQLLQTTRSFEWGFNDAAWPAYVRGLAYLRQQAGAEALAEFQKIIDRKGMVAASPLYPLAHLGLARAAALTGDTAKSRKAYQDFFALWKDADPDIPILKEAQRDYDKLSQE